jgi:hypothetical protein
MWLGSTCLHSGYVMPLCAGPESAGRKRREKQQQPEHPDTGSSVSEAMIKQCTLIAWKFPECLTGFSEDGLQLNALA